MLYRVTQESLSNVAQHAGAEHVRRRAVLDRPHRAARRATTAAASPRRTAHGRATGLGLSGMRERALLVGGRLDVFSAPGEGTTIELTMGAS